MNSTMDFTILLEIKKPNLSEASKRSYISGWKAIKRIFKIPTDDHNIEFLKNVENVIDTIYTESKENINTTKFKIAIVLEALKMSNELLYRDEIAKYKEYMDMLRARAEQTAGEHKMTEKQAQKWVSADEKDKILDYLKSNLSAKKILTHEQLLNYRNYLLYVLQTDTATRNDLAYSILMYRPTSEKKYKALPTTENYIILNKKDKSIEYIRNVFKTAKTHGQTIIPIKSELYADLDKYMKGLKLYSPEVEGGYWLFMNEDCKSRMTANRLGVVYAGLGQLAGLDKKLSTTVNRHQKASENFDAVKKIQENAKQMGHSVAMNLAYMVEGC